MHYFIGLSVIKVMSASSGSDPLNYSTDITRVMSVSLPAYPEACTRAYPENSYFPSHFPNTCRAVFAAGKYVINFLLHAVMISKPCLDILSTRRGQDSALGRRKVLPRERPRNAPSIKAKMEREISGYCVRVLHYYGIEIMFSRSRRLSSYCYGIETLRVVFT